MNRVPLPTAVTTAVLEKIAADEMYETYSDVYVEAIVHWLQTEFRHKGVIVAGCSPWYIGVVA